jgi:transposase InsO family protein
MAVANRTWSEERIAAELRLKLGIHVSPRTVRRYMRRGGAPRTGARSQTWSTFVRNHARPVLACDFFVTVTATFRVFYVFVVLEVETRRILHWNVTEYPTAEWTAQQFRMAVSGEQPYRWVIHDRDTIYTEGVDRTISALGLTVLKTPVRVPQVNAHCERLIGTIRRKGLDWVIPCTEQHLRQLLQEWVAHDNRGRPHASLGPGIPEPPTEPIPKTSRRHRFLVGHWVATTPILGGLHHEYRLEAA